MDHGSVSNETFKDQAVQLFSFPSRIVANARS